VGVDTLVPQPIRVSEDALLVRDGVMAVADEDSNGQWHCDGLAQENSVANNGIFSLDLGPVLTAASTKA